jgi:hypothetical protein
MTTQHTRRQVQCLHGVTGREPEVDCSPRAAALAAWSEANPARLELLSAAVQVAHCMLRQGRNEGDVLDVLQRLLRQD